jgi:CO/xanthine dehydrogenase Mo-binding subunit
VGQSLLTGAPTPFDEVVKNGIDPESGRSRELGGGRGVTHTAFSTECFIDELAAAARKDPVSRRLSSLEKLPLYVAVLKLAVEKAGWERLLAAGTVSSPAQRGMRRAYPPGGAEGRGGERLYSRCRGVFGSLTGAQFQLRGRGH